MGTDTPKQNLRNADSEERHASHLLQAFHTLARAERVATSDHVFSLDQGNIFFIIGLRSQPSGQLSVHVTPFHSRHEYEQTQGAFGHTFIRDHWFDGDPEDALRDAAEWIDRMTIAQ
jgi:hypothetical protein